jgi:phosphoenolpyruvate---glycerone phosphotransferase subunit DhaL
VVLDGDGARAWIGAFVAAFREQSTELDELDRRTGDGDFATNLLPAIDRAADDAELAPAAEFAAFGRLFMAAGGTSGPLFGVWFRELGRAGGDAAAFDLETLAAGVRAGVEAVKRLGGAKPGDKTMVDAMEPAAEALDGAHDRGESLSVALDAAAVAARSGAEATAELLARRGRASYVGEAARGVCDPGAVAVALFFEAHPAAPEDAATDSHA